MRVYGNLMNRIEEMNATKPVVGEGATICAYSDRHAATVVRVSPSGKTAWIQRDHAKRVDTNGMSESQEYIFSRNLDAPIEEVRLTKRGWRVKGGGDGVSFGHRSEYYDFSF